ncbi:MAG: hypothetical protein WC747_01005 [Candidatus Babeliales bacterium]|jgi:hypothetical protein
MKQTSKILFLAVMLSVSMVHAASGPVLPTSSEILEDNLENDCDPIILVRVKNNSNATTETSSKSGSASSNSSDQTIKNEKTMGWLAWLFDGWRIEISM